MSKTFLKLYEAINMLHTLSDSENADIVVLPPDNQGDVTDEEQDDENVE